jgi:two-component system, chemotaxis family, chemotaxis protein CheY
MKMLVVDDDFGARTLLREILRGHGETDIAISGSEALEAFKLAWDENDPYRIIWLDIMMPGVDGHYVLKSIREYEKNIGLSEMDGTVVVMTTALGDPENVLKAYQNGGVFEYMVKPLEKDKVVKILEKVKRNG